MSRDASTLPLHRAEKLYGWGRMKPADTTAWYPDLPQQLPALAAMKEHGSLLARGRGRSYGDAALNSGGNTVQFEWLDRVHEFDVENGIITCEAGLTLQDIVRLVLPHGWYLPTTPGTSHPSIGGSFVCDVHGKNHHAAGSMASHVLWFELVTADGKILRCSKEENADVFWATAGGMGMTGMVYRLSLKLTKVPSAYFDAAFIKTRNLDETMAELEAGDVDYTHTVAWLDCAAGGASMGRGEVSLGVHAPVDKLSPAQRRNRFAVKDGTWFAVPIQSPLPLVNPLTIRAFNNTYYAKRLDPRQKTVVHYSFFFYPLDVVHQWNLVYGKGGFVQYQYVVPFDRGRKVTSYALRTAQQRNQIPSLSVLKRFGAGNEGPLSFPEPGWTLAVDFPVKPGLMKMLNEFDNVVARNGGKVYIVKDHRLSPEAFRAMYPSFDEWLKVKKRIDPDWRFQSDLSRRLKWHEC